MHGRRRARILLIAAALAFPAGSVIAQDDAPAPASPAPAPKPAPGPAPDGSAPEARPATLPEPPEKAGDPEPGAEVVVILRDGERISGVFVARNADLVAVKVAGVEARIPAADVERVVARLPLQERYRQMRAMIDEGDVERLLLVAEWLRTNGMLDEANAEIEHILRLEPANSQAARLRGLVDNQRALRDRQKDLLPSTPRATPRSDVAITPDSAELETLEGETPTLSAAEINLIRVYELDLNDPPRVIIPRETIERLLTEFAGNPMLPSSREGKAEFFQLPPEEILAVMFKLQARSLYGEVQVLANPPSLRQFKDNVNRGWLATSCASTACHGGPDAGSLRLVGRRPSSDAAVYTNFLILDRARLSSGEPLIDFEAPDRSPLVQMGLPRADSIYPHPVVKGWNPTFRNDRAKRFVQTVEWINSMYQPRPEIPIAYPPPGEEPAPVAPSQAPKTGVPR